MNFPPVCLTIGPSDSSGGSGIQADLKTFTSLSCYGASAITAVCAQGLAKITHMQPLPADLVRAQLDAVAGSLPLAVVKVGLLTDVASVLAVAAFLKEHPRLPTVVDPVAGDATGVSLNGREVIAAVASHLLPRTALATPNRAEAALLSGMDECLGVEDMERAAEMIFKRHGCAVVVTGGGLNGGRNVDVLRALDGLSHVDGPAYPRGKVHGSGAAHSAAIAAMLAKGEHLREAVLAARLYTSHAIAAAPTLPDGSGVLWHGVTVREAIMVESKPTSGRQPRVRKDAKG
jgi:hydroxymethylpyrimidine kinase/phosphomethylpyrimidine kinase